jgi:bacterioferritin
MSKTDHTPFVMDLQKIRSKAREHILEGAVTQSYEGDRETVLKLLNAALATELVCTLRYRRDHYMAKGIHSESVAAEFLEHANEEQGHANLLAERIVQLGGEPNFNPDELSARSHSEYQQRDKLVEMIEENLVAERIAIDSYRAMIDYIGGTDSTTRRILEQILAVEEEHADELADLLQAHQ